MEIVNMQEVVERLKASKEKHENVEHERGEKAGHLWACEQADYVELVAVHKLVLKPFNSVSYAAMVDDAVGYDWRNGESLWMDDEGGVEHPSDQFVVGFVQSAKGVLAKMEGWL